MEEEVKIEKMEREKDAVTKGTGNWREELD